MSIRKQKVDFLTNYAHHSVSRFTEDYKKMLLEVSDKMLDEIYEYFYHVVYPFFEAGVKNTQGKWIYDNTKRQLFNTIREQFINICIYWYDRCAKPDKYNYHLLHRFREFHTIGIPLLFNNSCFKPYETIHQSSLIFNITS
jgi:hypothetical protein